MNKVLKKSILFLAVFILFLLVGNTYVFATDVTVPVTCRLNQRSAAEVLNIINSERAKVGRPALVWDSKLEEVAMQRAAELAGYFTHTRPNGQDCFQILDEFGVRQNYSYMGENIAYGYTSPSAVMSGWMSSTGHRENILNTGFNCVGIARIEQNGLNIWIQFFGYNTTAIDQNRSNYVGNRTTNVTIGNAVLITNFNKITSNYNDSVSINSFFGASNMQYALGSNIEGMQNGGYMIPFSFITSVTSDNPNIISITGDTMFASDVGDTNISINYQGISNKVPATVNRPDMDAILFDYRYYADNNSDLKAAFGYNEGALRNHWNSFGKKEGRQATPVFNAKYYLDNNTDLKATFGNNYEAAYNHFVNNGIAEFRKSSSEYWGQYYRDNNSDLKNFSNFKLIIHYINTGRNEGRKANNINEATPQTTNIDAIIFDANFYADMNSDLKQAYGYNATNLSNHWNMFGKKEGRVASPAFDVKYYLNNNSDLKAAFGNNYEAAINHFISCGAKEGRNSSAIFEVKYYLNNSVDLKKAFGEDYAKAYEHFVVSGVKEFRKTSSKFNIEAYKNKNTDLSKAFRNDARSYYVHYLTLGIKENRNCI